MLTVSTLSSGQAGDELKTRGGVSSDQYSGVFRAIASDASIARNFGSPLAPAVAAIASEVILLSSGPTAMNASMVGSRVSSSIWLVANCVTATLSSATPDSLRTTRSNAAFAGVRPITPTRCPARSAISLIFGARGFLEPLPGSPEGDHRTTKFQLTVATG